MKRLLVLFVGILFLWSNVNFAKDGKKYGKGVTLKETTKISSILENPKEFVGKKVLVEGTVVGVCANKGCWIDVAGSEVSEKIKVKVNDGEIVFPLTAKGKTILAEGIVEELIVPKTDQPTEEACEGDCGTKDAEKKIEMKTEMTGCADCASKENNKTYRIKGIGAIIK